MTEAEREGVTEREIEALPLRVTDEDGVSLRVAVRVGETEQEGELVTDTDLVTLAVADVEAVSLCDEEALVDEVGVALLVAELDGVVEGVKLVVMLALGDSEGVALDVALDVALLVAELDAVLEGAKLLLAVIWRKSRLALQNPTRCLKASLMGTPGQSRNWPAAAQPTG